MLDHKLVVDGILYYDMFLPGTLEGLDFDDELSVAMILQDGPIGATPPKQALQWQVGQAQSNGQNWREAAIEFVQLYLEMGDEWTDKDSTGKRVRAFRLWDGAEMKYSHHEQTEGSPWMESSEMYEPA